MLIARGLAVARLRVSILRYLLDLDPVGLSGILAHAVRGSDRRATCPAFPLARRHKKQTAGRRLIK